MSFTFKSPSLFCGGKNVFHRVRVSLCVQVTHTHTHCTLQYIAVISESELIHINYKKPDYI